MTNVVTHENRIMFEGTREECIQYIKTIDSSPGFYGTLLISPRDEFLRYRTLASFGKDTIYCHSQEAIDGLRGNIGEYNYVLVKYMPKDQIIIANKEDWNNDKKTDSLDAEHCSDELPSL